MTWLFALLTAIYVFGPLNRPPKELVVFCGLWAMVLIQP